ncbi:olfactory receptor 1009-like isoform X1 [Crotalus tigris]|uniref:olfactory receptor 1009-like isoform X1 n=1 Tax=Crotalus tigris TaxID=88082 RepID=UPI00192F59B9|nr:olfactory receptor 1009-like isoform X1 [Crotalus tigris]
MAMKNYTTVHEFIFVGFSDLPNLQIPLFAFFLIVYIITVTGNVGMILLIRMCSQLHTPMYFFLSNLSFVDLCYSSVVTPKILLDMIVKKRNISLTGCALQMWFFCLFLATECFLLAVMAYDRYKAISNPLLYTVIMSQRVCTRLAIIPYLVGMLNAITHTTLSLQLTFCHGNIINHFFCDIPAVISLSCSDTQLNKGVLFANHTLVYEFILVGFAGPPELQNLLFIFFLIVYVITLLGNFGMFLLIQIDSQLHTPMYFFLSNLSLLDLCYSSVVTPKMLIDFVIESKTISLRDCAAQMWFFAFFVAAECYLLASMAYDRYVAISNPLLYMVIMSRKTCLLLLVPPCFAGLLNAMTHTVMTFQLTFCKSKINHFFCDIPAVISLSCSETQINKMVLFIMSCTHGTLSSVFIIISYIYILCAILRIRSVEGQRKAFSTCSTHFTAVSIFYVTLFIIYVRPSHSFLQDRGKVFSVFYAVVIPMLNPLIYSVRNKEVQDSIGRMIRRKRLS